jgi:hypothetical protein
MSIVDEILSIDIEKRPQHVRKLIRQLVRDQYEHCACMAEDYVADHDLHEELTGLQVGDAIAEMFRGVADERCDSVRLQVEQA